MLDAGNARRRQAAIDFLLGRINYERVAALPYGDRHLKLDRMRTLLHRLGDPDAGIPIVHIAGTKGKGSTSALIAAVLQAAGYDVGVYSSPHLESIEERFCINGEPIAAGELADLVDRLRPIVQGIDAAAAAANDPHGQPTFFELTTALALMYFAQRQVDVIVLEVGLGGRLDSTNVCQPIVTVITSISLDHTRQLGDTTAKIASEKGGIIKPGVPLVLGPVDADAHAVLTDMARRHGARVIEAPRDFAFDYRPPHEVDAHSAAGELDFTSHAPDQPLELTGAPLRMLGRHQAANAALALAAAVELRRQGWLISTTAMQAGLAACTLPGRIEVVGREPTVVIDVSHNVASVSALVACLRESFSAQERILVFAASRDKDVAGMLHELLPHFDRVILTEYQENPRATPVAQLEQLCRDQWRRLGGDVVEEPPSADSDLIPSENPRTADPSRRCLRLAARRLPGEAWQLARQWAEGQRLICVTGSFFIAAELRPLAMAATCAAV
ncbi:MAG: bifunctional folylpolyglutamate synthase/dihydrofolate synthase [Planctomycetota bacterium]|nr:MAG: bifunctional folylpolyglutamate synthase/dihydrofolate synthase [Planctomycetota bacterium]